MFDGIILIMLFGVYYLEFLTFNALGNIQKDLEELFDREENDNGRR